MLSDLVKATTDAVVTAINGADDIMSAVRSTVRNQVTGVFSDADAIASGGI